jgi:hypothetical protein
MLSAQKTPNSYRVVNTKIEGCSFITKLFP